MEAEKGKTSSRVLKRRRAKPPLQEMKPWPPAGGERRWEWCLLFAGALLLALVAFISGVRMGKGLSDFRHMESSSLRTQTKGVKSSSPRPLGQGASSLPSKDKEAASGAQEKGKEKELFPFQTKERAVEGKISTSAEKVPAADLEKTKAPPPSKAKFTLQVAAFTNPDEAADLVNQLRAKGYAAYQVTGSAAAKGTLYRVRIGHFSSLPEARQFALTFEKKEKVKTVIASLE